MTTVKNPFVSSGDGPTNTTEADVIRLVFSDDTGNAVTPGRPTNYAIQSIYPTPKKDPSALIFDIFASRGS